jgi:hypothetical protein
MTLLSQILGSGGGYATFQAQLVASGAIAKGDLLKNNGDGTVSKYVPARSGLKRTPIVGPFMNGSVVNANQGGSNTLQDVIVRGVYWHAGMQIGLLAYGVSAYAGAYTDTPYLVAFKLDAQGNPTFGAPLSLGQDDQAIAMNINLSVVVDNANSRFGIAYKSGAFIFYWVTVNSTSLAITLGTGVNSPTGPLTIINGPPSHWGMIIDESIKKVVLWYRAANGYLTIGGIDYSTNTAGAWMGVSPNSIPLGTSTFWTSPAYDPVAHVLWFYATDQTLGYIGPVAVNFTGSSGTVTRPANNTASIGAQATPMGCYLDPLDGKPYFYNHLTGLSHALSISGSNTVMAAGIMPWFSRGGTMPFNPFGMGTAWVDPVAKDFFVYNYQTQSVVHASYVSGAYVYQNSYGPVPLPSAPFPPSTGTSVQPPSTTLLGYSLPIGGVNPDENITQVQSVSAAIGMHFQSGSCFIGAPYNAFLRPRGWGTYTSGAVGSSLYSAGVTLEWQTAGVVVDRGQVFGVAAAAAANGAPVIVDAALDSKTTAAYSGLQVGADYFIQVDGSIGLNNPANIIANTNTRLGKALSPTQLAFRAA